MSELGRIFFSNSALTVNLTPFILLVFPQKRAHILVLVITILQIDMVKNSDGDYHYDDVKIIPKSRGIIFMSSL